MKLTQLTTANVKLAEGQLALVSGGGAHYNAVVLPKENQGDGPFRSAELETPLALCPLDPKGGMYLINRRLVWELLSLTFLLFLIWMVPHLGHHSEPFAPQMGGGWYQ